MTTSPQLPSAPAPSRTPLRLRLRADPVPGSPDGAWWPQSRDLQDEAADGADLSS